MAEDVYREKPTRINKTLKITLPIPPSVNSMYVTTRGGGRRLTKKAENYVRDTRALINLEIEEQRWTMPEKHVWLYVDMVYYFPDRRIRDSHNCLKILMDVLQGKVFINDYTALPRIWSVEYDKERPRVELTVSMQTNIQRERGLKMVK